MRGELLEARRVGAIVGAFVAATPRVQCARIPRTGNAATAATVDIAPVFHRSAAVSTDVIRGVFGIARLPFLALIATGALIAWAASLADDEIDRRVRDLTKAQSLGGVVLTARRLTSRSRS